MTVIGNLDIQLGLLTRLFTATDGRPHESAPDSTSDAPAWMRSSVTRAQFEGGLDLAAEIGAGAVEISQAGQLSGAECLLGNPSAHAYLRAALDRRGLQIAALNCSGLPLHPVNGVHFEQVIRTTLRLAESLSVKTIVAMSGAGGDGAGDSTVNWVVYPWPEESLDLLERQWERAVELWRTLAALAGDHGVERIALELHPGNLVYNTPTLRRMREAVGPIIGANLDPSHLFWQQMDPAAVTRALGPAVHHVHLKDTEMIEAEMATVGVLDQRPFGRPDQRAWRQRTIGRGHDAAFWSGFLRALDESAYQGAVCIENEDPFQSYVDGVREAGAFLKPLLSAQG